MPPAAAAQLPPLLPPSLLQPSLLPRFAGGRGQSCKDFVRKFDVAQRLFGWTDELTMAFAMLHLDGAALTWCHAHDFTHWNDAARPSAQPGLREALLARFSITTPNLISLLNSRTQKPTETAREFADALTALARQAKIDSAFVDTQLLWFFLRGLQETDNLRRNVLLRHPQSLRDAVSEAEYFEALSAEAAGGSELGNGRGNTGNGALGPSWLDSAAEEAATEPAADVSEEPASNRLANSAHRLPTLQHHVDTTWPPSPARRQRRCQRCGEAGHRTKHCSASNPLFYLQLDSGAGATSDDEQSCSRSDSDAPSLQ